MSSVLYMRFILNCGLGIGEGAIPLQEYHFHKTEHGTKFLLKNLMNYAVETDKLFTILHAHAQGSFSNSDASRRISLS